MASSARSFISSYIIRDSERSIGCTVKSSVSDGARNGRLIGFDLNPDINEYSKVIQLSGDASLCGMIIPDTSLLVKIDDFFRGKFVGIEIRKDVRLRKQYVVNKGGKTIHIFSMDKVQYERAEYSKIDLDSLKSYVGGEGWQPVMRNKVNKRVSDQIDKRTPSDKVAKGISVNFQMPSSKVLYERKGANGKTIITEVVGDLFGVKSGLIINCISCDVHMGKGIATEFVKRFPEDKSELQQRSLRVGGTYIVSDDRSVSRGYLVTKAIYSGRPTEDTMKSCLKSLYRQCSRSGIKEVYMPRIGCGLDRMKWEDVREWIIEMSDGKDIKNIVLNPNVDDMVKKEKEEENDIKEPVLKEKVVCEWGTFDSVRKLDLITFPHDILKLIGTFLDAEAENVIGYKQVNEIKEIKEEEIVTRISCVLESESNWYYLVLLSEDVPFNLRAIAKDSDGLEHEVGLSMVG